MKRFKLIPAGILTCLVFMLIIYNTSAQSVNVSLNLLPPYNPRLFTYLKYENKAIITLINNTNNVQNIKLIGRVEGESGIIISTKQNYKPSAPIILNPRQTLVLNSATGNMDFLADKDNVETNGIEKFKVAVIKDGLLPEGNYTLCIQVLDYYTNQALSQEICWPLVISYVQPPVIINPINESNITNNLPQFSWTPAIGNTSSGNIRYDLYILKLTEGQNPVDAMRQAVNYNVGNPLTKTSLSTPNYIYTMSDWPLEENTTYALMVIAKDLNNLLYFANNGESEVSTFTYSPQGVPPPPPSQSATENFQCNCMSPLPSGPARTNFTLSQNDQFQIGSYTLTVTSISDQPDNQGHFSGEGTIPFPLSGGANIPVNVLFTDLQVNQSNAVISGSATANVNQDASFIPSGTPGSLDLTLTTTQAQDLQNYFNTHPSQLSNNAQSGVSINLPLGIHKLVDGESQIIAVTGLYFTAEKAAFDAVSAINIPDATPSVLGFGQKYICLDAGNLCNSQAVLFMTQDVNLSFITGMGDLLMKGKGTLDGGSIPSDSGTYVIFDHSGFKNLRIHAEYSFSLNSLVQDDNASQVTASISANATSWSDWIGTVDFHSDFKAQGIEDFVFHSGTAFYDHSDLRNPAGIPVFYTTNDPTGGQPLWHGFVITSGSANFPGQDLNFTVNNNPVSINISGLVIDAQGITVEMNESGILPVNNGKINGWRFSIDDLNVGILKNSINQGGFNGKMLLPIAHDTSFVNYSCLLNMDNGNLNYQFAIQQRDDLKVPMWKAKMDLEQSSSITVTKNAGVFNATADLNGSFDIDGNLDQLKKLKLRNIEFQNMTINSATDMMSVGTLSKGGSTDKSKISGFVLDVKQINAVPGTQPAIEFKSEIELVKFVSLPMAETNFKVYGKKSTVNTTRTSYEFDKGLIDSLKISGNLAAFKLNGSLSFYKDDQVYGDGFRGKLVVEVPKLVTVTCKAQFGSIEETNDDYKYWYFDAFAEFENGIAMFPPYIYGYGFGGGAYYHMRRDTASQKTEIATEDPENHKDSNTTPSGITYVPDKNISIGLKAMLLFGLQERKTFNADVNLEITFNSNEGFHTFYMDGNARVLAKDNKSKKAMVTGKLAVYYNHTENTFLANINGNLEMEVIHASIPSQIYFDSDDWYIYMGRPRPEEGCSLTIANLFALTAYFEAGTILDPVPTIPQDVLSILNSCGVNTSFLTQRNTALINGGRGIIFGADMEFHYSGTFLIIRGSLDARAGFDFSLQQTDYSCDESGDPAGINGWYAMGQLYASIEVMLSIHVDLSFYVLDVKILEAMAGAVLIGGGTNPTWIEGAIAGQFRILDGLIEGSFHYKFSHGDKCITTSSDVLESLDIIADIYPSEDDNTDISIDVFPTVATNLRITSNNFTIDEIDHENGTVTQRVFRFNSDNLTYSLKKTTSNKQENAGKILSEDGFGFSISPHNILSPLSEYELIIYATVDEFVNGSWQRAQKQDGTEFVETESVTFTTNQGLDKLADENIKYTIPFDRQRNFLPQGFNNGTINMIQNMDFNAFALPVDPADYNIEFFAEFIPLGSSSGQNIETPITNSGNSFNFDIPSGMQPTTIYCMQFKARWTPKQQSNTPFQLMQLKELKVWFAQGTEITQSQREINKDKLVIAKNEQLLYSIYFRTSEYADYTTKLNDLEIAEIVFDTKFARQSGGDRLYNTYFVQLSGDELQDNTTIMNNIRQKLNVAPQEPLAMLYPHGICLSGGEQFDEYEINGYSKPNKTGNTYTTDPVITLDEFSVAQYASKLFYDIVDLLEAGGATRFAVIPYTDELGGYVATKELIANTAPLLSDIEIFDGVEILYFPPYSVCDEIMLDNVITEPPAGNTNSGMTYVLKGMNIPVQKMGNNNSTAGTSTYNGMVFETQGETMQATYGLGTSPQQFVLPDKVNVISLKYHFNFSAGHGFSTVPNIFIDKAMGYTDPSPEMFGNFYSNVGQAFDMASESLSSVSIGATNLSATANASLGAIGGQVNLNMGGIQ